MDELIKEWTLINVKIEKMLDELELLEQEKEKILEEAKSSDNVIEIKNRMKKNVSQYEKIFNDVKKLKEEADILYKKIYD